MNLNSAAAIADFFESRIRLARIERNRARLRRELLRLPRYIARDIGVGFDQNHYVNFIDD